MKRFVKIDLSRLPAPDVIEPIDYEEILGEMKARAIELEPDLAPVLDLESEPAGKVLQVCAYYIMLARARVNDAGKAVMLAFATGSDLDHIGAMFGVARFPEEGDSAFRERVQLALEGFSTAGPIGAYIFHTRSADARVKDVHVHSPEPGKVVVTVLSHEADGTPADDLLAGVAAALNADNVRPLTDTIIVEAASVLTYEVEAVLHLFGEPDARIVRAAAFEATNAYVQDTHKLGRDVTISGLHAALHQPGVMRVDLISPPATIERNGTEAAFCTGISLATEVAS